MKKAILFIAFAATLGGSALQAQDTLWMKPAPLANYYNDNWFDTSARYAMSNLRSDFAHAMARQFVTDSPLQVYGIAAMMYNFDVFYFTPNSHYPTLQSYFDVHYPEDPTLDNCEESLLLLQYQGGPTPAMQQLGDSLPVHILNTPVSYYVMSNTSPVSLDDPKAKPVYERYFTEPQTVHDTFFVGFTLSDGGFSDKDSIWHMVRPSFTCADFCNLYSMDLPRPERVAAYRQEEINAPHAWYFYQSSTHYEHVYFIFPILTPPDTTAPPTDTVINPIDTTVNPIDTVVNPIDTVVNPIDTTVNPIDTTVVGIRGMDMLYRYTAVQPNPATDKVKVVSSFGLTRIEVYDEQGRKVSELRIPDSGPQATLDVSSWPRGTYLLRITTPVGPTTKKLLVQ